METIECVPRKWGNSLGITIPQDVAKRENILPGKPLIISLRARPDFKSLFGVFRSNQTTQEAKEEMRGGWK
jgi:antitoxin component of MazEF toxin-antitoxin module